jgi:hypothetical protein
MFLLGLIIPALMEAMIKVRLGASGGPTREPLMKNRPRTTRGLYGENRSL